LRRFYEQHRWVFVLMAVMILLSGFMQRGTASGASSIENKKLDIKYEEPAAVPGTNIAGSLLRLVLSLAFITGTAWVVLRFVGKRVNSRMQGDWIQVIDELILGPNKGIILCEVGGRIVAVGVTDHQISTLFEVTDEALVEEMLRKAEERRTVQSLRPMSQVWEQARRTLVPGSGTGRRKASRHFHMMMEEELKNIQNLRPNRGNGEGASKRGDPSE